MMPEIMHPHDVIKVDVVESLNDANVYLSTGRWILLSVIGTQKWDENHSVGWFLYSLGWLGPEGDASEFPLSEDAEDLPSWI